MADTYTVPTVCQDLFLGFTYIHLFNLKQPNK